MIIFDLDGTLRDCTHRQHLVQKCKKCNGKGTILLDQGQYSKWSECTSCDGKPKKPDWDAFYAAAKDDLPIEPTCNLLVALWHTEDVHIWTGHSVDYEAETIKWLETHLGIKASWKLGLKMRPHKDYTPDDSLKERWLLEVGAGNIQCVFEDRQRVVDMWRKHEIVCYQVDIGDF